jgi:hypothetical protein
MLRTRWTRGRAAHDRHRLASDAAFRAIRTGLASTLLISLAMAIAGASTASAGVQHEFAMFKNCPVNTPGVVQCLVSDTNSGEFKLGSKAVAVNKTITLEGAISETTSELVGATLSKTPLTIPGGLVGIELGGVTEVTATAELADPVNLTLNNLGTNQPALTMPLKVKLSNPALGEACYIGSSSEPVTLNLTSGTTSPPAPNKPITGTPGTFTLKDHSRLIVDSGSRLVDNSFAAPGVNGCGPVPLVVDPVVNLDAGLPAAAGNNTAILEGTLYSASARVVKAEALLPEIGRCTKVEPEKVGKEKFFHGHYESRDCVEENPQPTGHQNGEYEWTPGPGPSSSFNVSLGKTTLESVGKTVIKCVGASGPGQYTGTKTASATLTFTGCQRADSKASCQSAGAGAGEIVTSPLEGALGFIENVFEGETLNVSVGLDLKHTPTLFTAECGGSQLSVSGSVIAPVGAVDKMAASFTLKYKANGGKQVPEAFEETPKDTLVSTLGGGSPEQTGLTATGKIANGEKLEIRGATE